MLDQIITFVKDIAILLGISIVSGLIISPLVFVMTFVYDETCKRYKNIAPIIVIVVCTMLGIFLGLLLIYAYIKLTVKTTIA